MKKYHKQLKFLISGGLAAATEYITFLFIVLILPVLVANILSFALGLIVSFTLNRNWVFDSRSETKKKFVKYFSLALVNVIISTGLLFMLTTFVMIQPFLAKILTMALIALWNYLIFSRFIFKDETI